MQMSREMKIDDLVILVKKSKVPIFILVCGSLGSGKSTIVDTYLSNITVIDPDKFTIDLGNGTYYGSNVAKSMAMVKKAVIEQMDKRETFIQQGTSANLQSTFNKLKVAHAKGYKTILLYVDTSVEQAIKQIENRVSFGGHGATIDATKVAKTSAGAKLTFRTLTGVEYELTTDADLKRVEQALEKTENTIDIVRKYLDYFIRIENKDNQNIR